MSQEVSTVQQLKSMFEQPRIREKLNEVIGKNAGTFTTSLVQIVSSNNMLANADPKSIFNSALMAATLNLPLNNNLGFAHIVPYRNNKENKIEAQFQIGYKGLIQLSQRSGQFKTISDAPVYKGQLVKEDPLQGYEFDWSNKDYINEPPVGYVAYFKLLNGFEATLYMTQKDIESHALKYSKSYGSDNAYSPWKDNFHAMARKTVIKLLLSRYAPLSIDMQKALEADQGVVNDDGVTYIDNVSIEPTVRLATDEQIAEIKKLIETKGADTNKLCLGYQVQSIEELKRVDAVDAINNLKQRQTTKDTDEIPV